MPRLAISEPHQSTKNQDIRKILVKQHERFLFPMNGIAVHSKVSTS